jgi:uncharacterized protein YaaQ
MGLFKQKKDEEAKIQLEREALDRLNNKDKNLFDISTFYSEDELAIKGNVRAPHTLTAEELNGKRQNQKAENDITPPTDNIIMQSNIENNVSPTDFLYNKMMQINNDITNDYIKSEEPKPESDNEEVTTPQSTLVEDVQQSRSSESPLNLGGNAEERRVTLLARCNAYLKDANDTYKIDTEKYKLESVESILESFEARAAARINKKFNINQHAPEVKEPVKAEVNTTKIVNTTVAQPTIQIPPVTPPTTSSLGDTAIFTAQGLKGIAEVYKQPANEVKHIFTANSEPTQNNTLNNYDDLSSTRIISDISSSSKTADISSTSQTAVFQIIEPIIKTTPSAENAENVDSKEESIKSFIDDYKNISDRPRVLNSLVRKKNGFNIKLLISLICFIVALVFATPFSANLALTQTTINVIDLIICLIVLFTNIASLTGIKSLFNSKAKNSLPAALSILSALLFSIINLIFNNSFIGLSSLAALSLVSYNLAYKKFYSHAIKNFNLIATTEFKNAVSIIQNKNATKAIVGNSIDGSALVCYGGETTNVHNFLNYTFGEKPISSKIQKI